MNEDARSNLGTTSKSRFMAWIQRWWFVPVLLVAPLELGLHISQTRPVLKPEDWTAVRSQLEAQVQPSDLVVVSPSWLEPLGRLQLGDGLMTVQRVARADESRFPVAIEVSLGSARHPALASWHLEQEQSWGALQMRRLRNPDPHPVIDDLVSHATAHQMDVSLVRGEAVQPCEWRHGQPVTGPLGFGPAQPSDRYHCRNTWVGETINADLEYKPRRCIHAPPPGGQEVLRLRWKSVRFGTHLLGHHALYVEAERDRKGPAVRIVFSSDDETLGEAIHEDGQGWSSFAFDTTSRAGKTAELQAEISSTRADRRTYCFEVTTR
ncbi:MAG TPA: hypothetical protein PKL73_00510 [Polyangiaceae bacterium]|nr:hypothetical protein [Polyangiaceae bacterium]HNZ20662.1 hypothetical protein [Polyangiaceae bacterium]HOD20722.1 hypothetical protein [Polyangiaceae bacterium]HOG99192.1 hypothetical protein [Polyangiaceae bacterium]HOR33357.1 hypothetical protein [Polyangiaceae bacterium]